MQNDWFEVTTYPNDPTHIEMRRLSDEEAKQAAYQQYVELIQYYFPEAFVNIQAALSEFSDSISAIVDKLPSDPKAEARARSKADVKAKRRDMMKRRK